MAECLWTSGDCEVEGAEVCLEVDKEREGSGLNGRPGTNVRENTISKLNIHVTEIATSSLVVYISN